MKDLNYDNYHLINRNNSENINNEDINNEDINISGGSEENTETETYSANNEQWENFLLKQSYNKIKNIFHRPGIQKAIEACISNSVDEGVSATKLLNICQSYSLIECIGDIYLIPKKIGLIPTYLLIIVGLILVCIFMCFIFLMIMIFKKVN